MTSPTIANKDVSEQIVTAPFSPLGQQTHVKTSNATCMALPTNQSISAWPQCVDPEERIRKTRSKPSTRSTATQ